MTTRAAPGHPPFAPPSRTVEERNALALTGRRLVGHVLHRLGLHADRDVDALLSAGDLALLQAAARYDPGRGCTFGTYACHCIRRKVWQELRARDLIRVPEHVRGEKRAALAVALRPVSLDVRAGDGEGGAFWSAVPGAAPADAPAVEAEELTRASDLAGRLLALLPERHRVAVESRVMRGERLRAVGDRLGMTREGARQLVAAGLRKLRRLAMLGAAAPACPR